MIVVDRPLSLTLGLDPGLTGFGYALAAGVLGIDRLEFVECGTWSTKPTKNARKLDDTAERCAFLASRLEWLLQRHRPDAIAVEALAMPPLTTKATISRLGRVRGLVDYAAAVRNLPVLEFVPQAIKRELSAGNPSASKDDIEAAMVALYPELAKLLPAAASLREHAADAAAVLHTAHRRQFP